MSPLPINYSFVDYESTRAWFKCDVVCVCVCEFLWFWFRICLCLVNDFGTIKIYINFRSTLSIYVIKLTSKYVQVDLATLSQLLFSTVVCIAYSSDLDSLLSLLLVQQALQLCHLGCIFSYSNHPLYWYWLELPNVNSTWV